MVTTLIFVRHCESDGNHYEDTSRTLIEKNLKSAITVTNILSKYKVDVIYSSPNKMAVNTIKNYAEKQGLSINIIDCFTERHIRTDDFEPFTDEHLWNNINLAGECHESLEDVQIHNIKQLKILLKKDNGKTVVLSTHGCSLNTILNYYNPKLTYDIFAYIIPKSPYMVKLEFENERCISMNELLTGE